MHNVSIQEATNVIIERTHLGIKINGYNVDMLRFTDDIAIIAKNEKDIK